MSVIKDFKDFATRGNLLDMAIGFTVGAAFSTIAKSLVNDIIMPPIGLLTGNTDFSDLYFLLRKGASESIDYKTLADAQADGAITMNYGMFINNLVAFLLIALAMFAIIRFLNRMEDAMESRFSDPADNKDPMKKKCTYCRSMIPYKASRCPFCTSDLSKE